VDPSRQKKKKKSGQAARLASGGKQRRLLRSKKKEWKGKKMKKKKDSTNRLLFRKAKNGNLENVDNFKCPEMMKMFRYRKHEIVFTNFKEGKEDKKKGLKKKWPVLCWCL
jgi:peroxiredoxin family protein